MPLEFMKKNPCDGLPKGLKQTSERREYSPKCCSLDQRWELGEVHFAPGWDTETQLTASWASSAGLSSPVAHNLTNLLLDSWLLLNFLEGIFWDHLPKELNSPKKPCFQTSLQDNSNMERWGQPRKLLCFWRLTQELLTSKIMGSFILN